MRFRFLRRPGHESAARNRGRLPALIIPGAMKAGTTSLFGYLEGHPQLAASREKEVHYFDMHFHRGAGWYERQFPRPSLGPDGRRRLPFESSPYYLFEPRVPARIRKLVPDVKLVVLLRDPVERAFSHYHNNLRLGREPLSFEDALDAEPTRLAGEEDRLLSDPASVSIAHRRYSYLQRGIYADQLVRWREYFAAEQMLVIDAGRLFSDPGSVVAEVVAFLGLLPWAPASFAPLNVGRHEATIRPETRARLEAFFEPHQRRLEALIGWRPSPPRAAKTGSAAPFDGDRARRYNVTNVHS